MPSICADERNYTLTKKVAAVICALVLCSCAKEVAYQSDVNPHPGVRRAHGLPIQGIDVSRYQGAIDWEQVHRSGVRFAYIKATEGADRPDSNFLENWRRAAAAGLPRGAYHFMYWCRAAEEQAALFAQTVPHDRSQMPPVLDLEWNNTSTTCPEEARPERALAKIERMLGAMERHTGKKPIIYTDIAFHREVLEGKLTDYEFWLRSVAAEPDRRFRNRAWIFWQYSATGRVPGVGGDVDRNAFRGSVTEWSAWLKQRGVESVHEVAG